MPIYAYRCGSCGHQKDVLQKISEPILTQCPECREQSFSKQLSAPAFQLKGGGWYVTDFRDGKKETGKEEAKTGDGKTGEVKSEAKSETQSVNKAADTAASSTTSAVKGEAKSSSGTSSTTPTST